MKKLLIASVAVAAFATPALADFWIVQDASTKKCTIVEQKPTTTTTTVVGGDGKVYKTKVEAENSMKTEKVCTETR
jgi:hypothetical protein